MTTTPKQRYGWAAEILRQRWGRHDLSEAFRTYDTSATGRESAWIRTVLINYKHGS